MGDEICEMALGDMPGCPTMAFTQATYHKGLLGQGTLEALGVDTDHDGDGLLTEEMCTECPSHT